MSVRKYTYVIVPATQHKQDFNQNGRVSPGDDIVERYEYNPSTHKYDKFVDFKLLKPIQARLEKVVKKDVVRRSAPRAQPAPEQRVVYTNVPRQDPPPVAIKDETSFGQYVKQGAGNEVGALAVDSMFLLVGSLFS